MQSKFFKNPNFPSLYELRKSCKYTQPRLTFLKIFEWKIEERKGRKNFFFVNSTKDDNVFYTYISMITTIKIFTFWYIKNVQKNVYTFLIKLLATAKQLIRRNSICRLKNQAIFHRVGIKIGLTPPPPQPPPPPSTHAHTTTNPLLKTKEWRS